MKAIIAVTLLYFSIGVASAAENRADIPAAGNKPPEPSRNRVLRPLINEKVEFYEISWECDRDLQKGMRDKGCAWKDGKKYHSLTSWSLKWDYGYNQTSLSCTAESFQPVIDINIRYPKWAKTGNPPAELQEKWDRFMTNLITHEEGHRDMVVEAASEAALAVMRLPPQATCADLDREVKKLCHTRMKQLDEDSKNYDAETKHGLTQGAVFP